MPVSRTVTWIRIGPSACCVSCWALAVTTTSPVWVNLTAFDSRLTITWRKRVTSPTTRLGQGSSSDELEALVSGRQGQLGEGVLGGVPQVERLGLELEFA